MSVPSLTVTGSYDTLPWLSSPVPATESDNDPIFDGLDFLSEKESDGTKPKIKASKQPVGQSPTSFVAGPVFQFNHTSNLNAQNPNNAVTLVDSTPDTKRTYKRKSPPNSERLVEESGSVTEMSLKERRKLQNRVASANTRQRKKDKETQAYQEIDALKNRVQFLENENQSLKMQIANLMILMTNNHDVKQYFA